MFKDFDARMNTTGGLADKIAVSYIMLCSA